MNLTNLKRMYNHILENVPEEKIFMKDFRDDADLNSHECKSVGCVLGHCTILDDFEKIPKYYDGDINFFKWSENFSGLTSLSENWDWCFSGKWSNNKEQILLRIKYLIDNKHIPYNWNVKDFNYLLPKQNLERYEFN